MIEFKGRLSNKCKKYLIKSSWQLGFFVVIAVCIPFIILSIVLSIMDDWVYLVMLLPIGLFIFFASLKPETRAYRELYGKNGKIYATTSSCLSGNEDYIGITIKKESVVYKKYINILSALCAF